MSEVPVRVFTEEEKERFRERFAQLDINKTGFVSRETMFDILGQKNAHFDQLLVVLLFKRYDIDGNDQIDFEEFCRFCETTDPLSEIALLRQIFECVDKDKSGLLDVNEVMEIGRLMGCDVSQKDAWATVDALDQDGNRQVDFAEFCALLG